MLSGYRKNMYYVRDTGSRFFKEAYFVLREGTESDRISETDLASEADRILRERFPVKRRRMNKMQVISAVMFIMGIAVGACAVAVL